jgi:hypothetical protein
MGLELCSGRTFLILTPLNRHWNRSKSQCGIPCTLTTDMAALLRLLPRFHPLRHHNPLRHLRRLCRLPIAIPMVSEPNLVLLRDVIFAFIYPCFLKQCRAKLLTIFLLF